MSTPYCLSDTCLNGNCEGCRNGEEYCNDPRCYPNCPNCSGKTDTDKINGRSGWDWTLIIIIGVLVILVIILLIVMYQRWSKVTVKTVPALSPQTMNIPPVDLKASYDHYDPILGENEAQIEINTMPLDSNNQQPVNYESSNYESSNYNNLPEIPQPEFQKADVKLPPVPIKTTNIVPPPVPDFNTDNFNFNNPGLNNYGFDYNEGLDTSLNVTDLPYSPPNPVTQTSFTTSIDNPRPITISDPTNVSVASGKILPSESKGLSLDMRDSRGNNDVINGF